MAGALIQNPMGVMDSREELEADRRYRRKMQAGAPFRGRPAPEPVRANPTTIPGQGAMGAPDPRTNPVGAYQTAAKDYIGALQKEKDRLTGKGKSAGSRHARALGEVLLPALFARTLGGEDWSRSAAYGVGTAAQNYRNRRDKISEIDDAINAAKMNLPVDATELRGQHLDNQMKQFKIDNPAYMSGAPSATGPGGTKLYQTYKLLLANGDIPPGTTWQEFQSMNRATEESGTYADYLAQGGDEVWGPNGYTRWKTQMAGSVKDRQTLGTEAIKGRNAMATTVTTYEDTLAKMYNLRDKLAKGPATYPGGQWSKVVDPDLQAVYALTTQAMMDNMAAMRASGVTPGQISEGEWKMVGATGPQVQYTRDANLQIMDNKIAELERAIGYWRRLHGSWKGPTEKPLPQTGIRGGKRPATSYIPGSP